MPKTLGHLAATLSVGIAVCANGVDSALDSVRNRPA